MEDVQVTDNSNEVVDSKPVETPKREVRQEQKERLYSANELDQISNLQKAVDAERSEAKKLKRERDELAKLVQDYTVKEKKAEALNAALSNLGEDFEVASDKLPTLNKLISKIQDSETLADDIAEAVSLIKSTKAKEQPSLINSPFNGPATNHTDAKALSAEDKMRLSKENPAEYQRLYGFTF